MIDALAKLFKNFSVSKAKLTPRETFRRYFRSFLFQQLEDRRMLAGEFTDLGNLGISGTIRSGAPWGDFDNDGDLDVLVVGSTATPAAPISRIFRNDNGTFVDHQANLIPVFNGTAAWGDYDNDGDLDILLAGRLNSNFPISANDVVSKVYRNDGGSFVDIGSSLPGVRYSSVAWGDYDNDGDLDFLLTGRTSANINISRIYRNDRNDTFTEISTSPTGISFSSVAWGDYDTDGDLDILLSGTSSPGVRVTQIFRNDAGNFTDISAGLIPLNNSSAAWGDYDNDGDLDILIAGQQGSGQPISLIYRNDGAAGFTNTQANLPGLFYGAVAWGDYDNDGDLDFLLTGRTGPPTQFVSSVYRNNGASGFTDISAGILGMDLNSVAWGDYDNDRDLDIVAVGRNSANVPVARVFRNNTAVSNVAPAAPSGLQTTVLSSDSVQFSWVASSDAQTPTTGLSYNLRVGTTPGGSEVFSSMANGVSGFRRISTTGPIQRTSHVLKGLSPSATYYWSVQAIDTAFAGSSFATSTNFSINSPPVLGGAVANQGVNDNATISSFGSFTIFDADAPAQTLTVEVRLSNASHGAFTAASLSTSGFIDQSGGVYRFIGTASQAQTAIRQLVFKPTENLVPAGSTFTAIFTVSASDGIALPISNGDTSVIVTAVKDTPSVSVTPAQTSSPFGYAIVGQASLSGGFNPTGTVTFRLYDNPAGTGSPIFTDTQPLSGVTATSAKYFALVPGNLYWVATYNGDSENNAAMSGASAPVVVATPIFVGGAYWYLGPGTVGSELQVNRYVPGESPVWVDGRSGTQIGQALDGSVLVRNAAQEVFVRSGSLSGIGTSWNLLSSVIAGDGATWFLGPDNAGGDPFIYRWADGDNPAYTGGAGIRLFVANGSVFTQTGSGDYFQNIGSNVGFSANWQQLARVINANPASLNLGSTIFGSASSVQTFSVSGIYLSANLVVTAPAGIELSRDNGATWQTSQTLVPSTLDGSIASTWIQARISNSAGIGALSGNITVTSSGASSQNVSVSGSVTEVPSLIVTTTNDVLDSFDNVTSLREAVALANLRDGADTIQFDASLATQTFVLSLGQLELSAAGADNRTTILGPLGGITISGGQANRVFQINGSVFAALNGLTIIDGYATEGGAILNAGGHLSVWNTVLRNNVAYESVGGAISNYGSLDVVNSLFFLNRAVLGGAINSSDGLSITDTTFSTNEASFNGGALRVFGTTNIIGSTFSNNQAANGGGALINHGNLTLTNSTIAFNVALDGGGLQAFEGTANLRHVTITANTATRSGGGVIASPGVTAVNTIIVGNAGVNGNDLFGALESGSSNNLLNMTAAAAGLGIFTIHGGRTETFSLLPGSPAIDAGNTSAAAGLATDQRGAGFNRVAGAAVDIGAYELQNQPPTFTSPTAVAVPENTQFVLTLTAIDPDLPVQMIAFAIAGNGLDNDKFQIVKGNQLRFISPPNFENPLDLGGTTVGDNIYVITVQADDGNGGTTLQTVSVTVTDIDEVAPLALSFRRETPTQMVTNADSLQFRVEFSEQVMNVGASDFIVQGSNATIVEIVPVQGTGEAIFLITVSGGNLASFNGSVGLDLSPSGNITDLAGNSLTVIEPSIDEVYLLDNIAPRVNGVIVDNGSNQRSRVRSLTINFDSNILFDAGAFELMTTAGASIAVQTDVLPGTATNRIVLTFPGTIGGSLADGVYRLRTLGNQIRDVAGNLLNVNGGRSETGVRVDEFFRYFGDRDGDRDVDAIDLRGFRATYLKMVGQPGFNDIFDFDGDNDVDANDLKEFNLRYRTRLNPKLIY